MAVDNEALMLKLGEFHSEFTEFRGEIKARLTQVEKDADKVELWNNIKLVCVLPVTVAMHALGTRIGLIKR
jgi:hypothetical protein